MYMANLDYKSVLRMFTCLSVCRVLTKEAAQEIERVVFQSYSYLPPGIRHNTPPIKNTKQWRPAAKGHRIYRIQTRALHSLNKKYYSKRVVYIVQVIVILN